MSLLPEIEDRFQKAITRFEYLVTVKKLTQKEKVELQQLDELFSQLDSLLPSNDASPEEDEPYNYLGLEEVIPLAFLLEPERILEISTSLPV